MRLSTQIQASHLLLFVALVITLIHHYIIRIPQDLQWIFLGISLLVTGIPHGALDHLVARQNHDKAQKKFSLTSFYIRYLSRMLIFGLFWLIFPGISLIIFLLISAFHFGETDLPIKGQGSNSVALIFQTVYGSFVLLVLLLAHQEEVMPLLSLLTRDDGHLTFSPGKNDILLITFSGIIAVLASGVLFAARFRPGRAWLVGISAQTVAILIILIFLPLPLAFAFYFGCWHSINALQSIRDHLSSSIGAKISWMWIFKKVVPFTLLALLGISIGYILINSIQQVYVPLQAFIIGVAMLTAPHLEVMNEMYKLIRK